MKEKLKEILPYIIIFIVVILFRTYIATPVIVNGPSMQETLHTNDVLILRRTDRINRYDIVVANHNGDKLIKRVMGIPGDKIKCVSGTIYVNNEEISSYGYGTSFDFPQVVLMVSLIFAFFPLLNLAKYLKNKEPFQQFA